MNSPLPVTNTLSVTERDFISAQRLHAAPPQWLSATLLAGSLLAVAYCYQEHILSFAGAFEVILGLLAWLCLRHFVILPFQFRRIYRQQKNLTGEHQFSWDEQFIYFHSENYDGKVPWADFRKCKENKTMLLLYHSDVLFNIFPKACFPSSQVFAEFRSHVV